MSTPFPNDFKDNKHTGSKKGFLYWELAFVLLVTMCTLLYCFTGLFGSIDSAREKNRLPTPPLLADKERTPPVPFVNANEQNAANLKTGNAGSSLQSAPVPAPAAIKANVVQSTSAMAQKPENKPVQKAQSMFSSTPPVPAQLPVKAGPHPATVVAANGDQAPQAAKEIKKTEKPLLKNSEYTLLFGEFPDARETANTRMKLKKLGISPIRENQVKKPYPTSRLFLASFADHATADKEFRKLRKLASGAFIEEQNGKYSVYAGSFSNKKKAVVEQKFLATKKFKVSNQTAQIATPLTRVTAGSFTDCTVAAMKARRLKKQGFHVKAIKVES